MLKRVLVKTINYFKLHGGVGLLSALYGKIRLARSECFAAHAGMLATLKGLEIGGPSRIFSARGVFPVYPLAGALDNVTFAAQTLWEGKVAPGRTFVSDRSRPPGRQYILDSTSLREIGDESYDFLLSSHVLEHLANPLRGLKEWKRVVRENGLLVIIVPHKDGTFDHLRPVTSIDHMIADYEQGVDEGDLTHVDEILRLHDLNYDDITGRDKFEIRIRNNAEERSMHHHVYATRTLAQMLDCAGLQILSLETIRPCHIVSVARKVPSAFSVDNKAYLDVSAAIYANSPFRTDRAKS